MDIMKRQVMRQAEALARYGRLAVNLDHTPAGWAATEQAHRLKALGIATGRDLHVDQHLTNIAINYAAQTYIAAEIAPVVPVDKETNLFPVFSRQEKFALETTRRARGAEANKVTRTVGSLQYQCQNYALGYDIATEDRANMDTVFRNELDTGATVYLLDKLNLDMEKRVITLADATTSVSTVFVPNSAWGQQTNYGDPISECFQAIEQMQATCGQRPNSVLFGWRAWNWLKRNPAVRNFVRGSNNGGGVVTRQQVQDMFEVERFNVSEALWQTANEAQPIGTLTNVIQDDVFFYYAPRTASTVAPSWMYSFRWSNPILPTPLVVERHPYDTRKKVETIEAGYYQDERITGSDYAVKIGGVNSAQANGLV